MSPEEREGLAEELHALRAWKAEAAFRLGSVYSVLQGMIRAADPFTPNPPSKLDLAVARQELVDIASFIYREEPQ